MKLNEFLMTMRCDNRRSWQSQAFILMMIEWRWRDGGEEEEKVNVNRPHPVFFALSREIFSSDFSFFACSLPLFALICSPNDFLSGNWCVDSLILEQSRDVITFSVNGALRWVFICKTIFGRTHRAIWIWWKKLFLLYCYISVSLFIEFSLHIDSA